MVNKCACNSTKCACLFADTISVTVTGDGTVESPFTPNVPLPLIVNDTSTLDLELVEGSLYAYPISTPVNVQEFTADGTWTKPVGVTLVRYYVVGGGGGGGRGSASTSSATALGGGGGTGGNVTSGVVPASALGATEPVIVGTGGLGGASAGAPNGTAGTASSFGAFIASGGGGGIAAGGAGGAQGTVGVVMGGVGESAASPYSTRLLPRLAPGGGGRGSSWNGTLNGWNAVGLGTFSRAGLGNRTGGPTGAGSDGLNEPVLRAGWGGNGGSGAADIMNGGNGGFPGGGGGGGAHAGNAFFPGIGGDGAPGIVLIVAW